MRQKTAKQADKAGASAAQARGAAPSDLLVLAASALFWAWFDSGVFRPTFFAAFPASSGMFLPYLLGAIASGGAVLLAACLTRGRSQAWQDARRWPTAAALALLGSAFSLTGGALELLPLVVAGSLCVGASCGVFQFAWGEIYARGESGFAGRTVAASIALGVLVDCLVMGLAPGLAAAFTAALPLASAGLAQFLSHTGSLPQPAPSPAGRGSSETVFGSHRTVCGLPLSLLVAFALFGLSFGYCQHSAVFLPADAAAYSSDALIAARGITSLAIWVLLAVLPRRSYTVFKVGTLVGIAGFVAAPMLALVETHGIAPSAVIAVGYTTFDVATWALVAELAATTGTGPTRLVGCGRFAIHLGEVAAIAGCSMLAGLPGAAEAISSTLGYGCVVAEMLLLADNSALWLLVKSDAVVSEQSEASSTRDAPSPGTSSAPSVARVAAAHSLTERESEVLALLLAGHGRARVAQALGISENTLGTHIQQLYRKLDVHSRQELLDRFGK